jgi:ferritin-like metal-binding protein YciE
MPEIGDPRQLFQHKLGAALTMERTVLEMLKTNEQKAQDNEIKQQFAHHREETQGQIRNLEQAFSALGSDPQTQPCPTIDGLKTEAEQMISKTSGQLVDAVLVDGAAETEHHEIAVYEGLITNAEAMGEQDVVALLQENLEQEQHTLKEVQAAGQQLAQQLATQRA